MGLADVKVDPHCIVTGTLPANHAPDGTPAIGFIAHLDTVEPGKGVKPQVIDRYEGGDIVLNEREGVVLSPAMFPDMKEHVGQRLVVTDGTTVLGADDKAGIAAILTALEELMAHPEIPHGVIRVAFTPDEEIGAGTAHFDARDFGVDFGYTMDGGGVGGFQYENFNAAHARVTVHGNSIHPGSAKGYMVHAATIAAEFTTMIPQWERAETTEGYEGFTHLNWMHGEVETAQLDYIIRDFDAQGLERRKNDMVKIAGLLNGEGDTSTPLQIKLAQLGKYLGVLAIVACVIVFIVGVLNGIPVLDIFMTAVSLAVSAIPEGLPAIVTIVLSIGVQRMAKKHAIIRRLPAVETLGSASVICSDKTGTLTQNRMTLVEAYLDEGHQRETISKENSPALRRLLAWGTLCSDGSITCSTSEIRPKRPSSTPLIKTAWNRNSCSRPTHGWRRSLLIRTASG